MMVSLSDQAQQSVYQRTQREFYVLYLDRNSKAREVKTTGHKYECFLVAEVRLEDGRPDKSYRAGWQIWHIPTHMQCTPKKFSNKQDALGVIEMVLKLVPLEHWQFEYPWTDRDTNENMGNFMVGSVKMKYAFRKAERLVLLP